MDPPQPAPPPAPPAPGLDHRAAPAAPAEKPAPTAKQANALSYSSESVDVAWEDVATIRRGTTDGGAVFVIGVPKASEDGPAWNQCLLLHAHGFRAADAPLMADLDDKFWLRLIQLGWAVGVTSYRRSGKIVQEAIKDLNNLRNWVCNEIGFPIHTFIDGRSMGGFISTALAEMPGVRAHYSGVMAIGAALLNAALPLRNRPGIPILYLTNISEIGPIQAYITAVRREVEADRKNGIDEIVVPAIHHLGREGHNWSNARERWVAFQILLQWVCAGSNVTKRDTEAVVQPGEAATGARARGERDAAGRVVAVHGALRREPDVHCRLFTNFTMGDFRDIGVRLNQGAAISIDGNRLPFQVVLSSGYPYTQHSDPNTVVANEDPEGALFRVIASWMIIFEVAMLRNSSPIHLNKLASVLKTGASVTLHAPPAAARGPVKRLAMPAPVDL